MKHVVTERVVTVEVTEGPIVTGVSGHQTRRIDPQVVTLSVGRDGSIGCIVRGPWHRDDGRGVSAAHFTARVGIEDHDAAPAAATWLKRLAREVTQ